ESGKDIWRGGAQYYSTATTFVTGVDAGNSLLALKKLVFEDKDISISDVKKALLANFEGYEILQKKLLNVPKHGNNIKEDDAIIKRVYQDAWELYQEGGENYLGKYAKPDAYSKSVHDYFGQITGALPTGRKAGIALTDGSVSAQPGTDQKGPSALAISASGAIDTVLFNSAHLNVKLNPDTFKSAEGKAALLTLIDTYVKHGGNHIQFNSVDAAVLRDAKAHPENHKDLVVRVAGFSAFFVKLHEGIQDEVIARTEHNLAV
ncbi:MAG: formate acetyltransferase, partial [Acetatifactor sp.]|nr:formate acetyltransferase [Acetatifactor sp.]